MSWFESLIILAADPPPAADNGMSQLLSMTPFLLIGVVFVMMVLLPGSREQKKRQAQLAGLKKNDRVYTSSGIIGTVANISADGKEVTLKVDDNTRLRVFRRAIEGFYAESGTTDQPPAAS